MITWFQIGYMLREIALREGTVGWNCKSKDVQEANRQVRAGWVAHQDVTAKA